MSFHTKMIITNILTVINNPLILRAWALLLVVFWKNLICTDVKSEILIVNELKDLEYLSFDLMVV